MTPAEVKSRLAGDPTFDMWDETKQLWFCGRVVDIQSAIESMKGPDYSVPLDKLKSSLRKTLAALGLSEERLSIISPRDFQAGI